MTPTINPTDYGFSPHAAPGKNRMPRGKALTRYNLLDLNLGDHMIVPDEHISGVRNYMYKFQKAGRGEWIARRTINAEGDRVFFRVIRVA